jgi:sigma-B regulation protein RsbU (phosphoserine phosphatase)
MNSRAATRYGYPSSPSQAAEAVRYTLAVRSGNNEALRGGDVFETYTNDRGETSIFLADVSSKGPLAVIHAEMLRETFQDAATLELRPRAILARLNRARLDLPNRGMNTTFASAFVASFDPATSEIVYASAGHELALVFRGRAHQHLKPTGPIVGILPGATYEDCVVPFDSKDLLIVATDGVSESRSRLEAGREFGSSGIARALSGPRPSGCSAAELVLRSADAFCGGDYRDDAMVASIARA